jgi:hypothetical protein
LQYTAATGPIIRPETMVSETARGNNTPVFYHGVGCPATVRKGW